MLPIFLNSARKRRILPAKCQLSKLDYPKFCGRFYLEHTQACSYTVNVDKTLLGLFTSFVGRREFVLSVVETTCLEETLFKVVRACMRKTVLRMIL